MTTYSDPILEELWRIKDARAKRFNYDVHAMWLALREAEKKHPERLVTLAPRRAAGGAKK